MSLRETYSSHFDLEITFEPSNLKGKPLDLTLIVGALFSLKTKYLYMAILDYPALK